MKLTNSKSGPGGAHIGFSMFGAHGPLRDEEGDGGSPAPAVASPPVTTAAPGEPAPAPGAASEKMLPQSQVSTLIAEAKRDTEAKTRAKVLQEIEAKAAPPTPKPTAPKGDGNSMSIEDVQALLARDRAFTRATATAGLNDRQLTRMEAALKADAPADVAAWSASYIEDLGLAKPTPQPAAIAATAAPAAPPAPSAAPQAPSGAVNPMTNGGLLDIFNLTPAQVAQLGPAGVRAELDKARALHHQTSGLARLPKVPERK